MRWSGFAAERGMRWSAGSSDGARRRWRGLLAGALLGVWLVACAAKLDGTYADAAGVTEITFRGGGVAYVSVLGIETEMRYTVDGTG